MGNMGWGGRGGGRGVMRFGGELFFLLLLGIGGGGGVALWGEAAVMLTGSFGISNAVDKC
jgi:hypothetical protein